MDKQKPKMYSLQKILARLFGARKAKRLINSLLEDTAADVELFNNSRFVISVAFYWHRTKQGHDYWAKVETYAERKIKGY